MAVFPRQYLAKFLPYTFGCPCLVDIYRGSSKEGAPYTPGGARYRVSKCPADGHFFDAQDSGSMGGGRNPGFKTQEPSSSLCLAAELLGRLRHTHHYLLLGLSLLTCPIEIKTPAWFH